jgi:predicted amidohydrolase
MTNLKTVEAPVATDGIAPVEEPQPIAKTQELPAIDSAEPEGMDTDAVPSLISDGDITVPVDSSIETALTFEALRRQSTEDDDGGNKGDDDGKP